MDNMMRGLLKGELEEVEQAKHIGEVNSNASKLAVEVTGIKEEVDKVNGRVDNVQNEMAQMKSEIEAVKQMARAPRTSAGSSSSATSTSTSTTSPWVPRIIQVRGWAPFGSNEDRKLSRATALSLQKHIDTFVLHVMKNKYRWLNPYIRHHSIAPEALHSQNSTAELLADALREVLQHHNVQVNETDVKVAVETSPQRREMLKIYYRAADELKMKSPCMRYTRCERALDLWDFSKPVRLGWLGRVHMCWCWSPNVLETLGFNMNDDGDKQDKGAETPVGPQDHEENKDSERQQNEERRTEIAEDQEMQQPPPDAGQP